MQFWSSFTTLSHNLNHILPMVHYVGLPPCYQQNRKTLYQWLAVLVPQECYGFITPEGERERERNRERDRERRGDFCEVVIDVAPLHGKPNKLHLFILHCKGRPSTSWTLHFIRIKVGRSGYPSGRQDRYSVSPLASGILHKCVNKRYSMRHEVSAPCCMCIVLAAFNNDTVPRLVIF